MNKSWMFFLQRRLRLRREPESNRSAEPVHRLPEEGRVVHRGCEFWSFCLFSCRRNKLKKLTATHSEHFYFEGAPPAVCGRTRNERNVPWLKLEAAAETSELIKEFYWFWWALLCEHFFCLLNKSECKQKHNQMQKVWFHTLQTAFYERWGCRLIYSHYSCFSS